MVLRKIAHDNSVRYIPKGTDIKQKKTKAGSLPRKQIKKISKNIKKFLKNISTQEFQNLE